MSVLELIQLTRALEDAEKRIAVLETALQYYADPKNWYSSGYTAKNMINDDCASEWHAGSRSRAALIPSKALEESS